LFCKLFHLRHLFILLFAIQGLLISCSNSNNLDLQQYNIQKDYSLYRTEFDEYLTAHFPDSLRFVKNSCIANTNLEKNDVGFFLYEYGVDESYINHIKSKLKAGFIAKYTPNEGCLLVVNRFESYYSHFNNQEVLIKDSSMINRPCYDSLFPIPNFISNEKRPKAGPVWLDPSFTIYVIEAAPNKQFKKFPMEKSFQMPEKWKNGFSKGIAISEKKKTIIYWMIIW